MQGFIKLKLIFFRYLWNPTLSLFPVANLYVVDAGFDEVLIEFWLIFSRSIVLRYTLMHGTHV